VKPASPEKIRSWSSRNIATVDSFNSKVLELNNTVREVLSISYGHVDVDFFNEIVTAKRGGFGHIELSVPVLNTLFLYYSPLVLETLTGLYQEQIRQVIYYKSYIVIDPG